MSRISLNCSSTHHSARSEFEEGRRRLYDLLERVEGCSQVIDVQTRFLLHDADLVEMDVSENTALHRVHGYLMNDGFMVATWLPNRRGPIRFKYSCLYELDSLAVVNVRDLGGLKHAFKLLVFPDARLFQCANGEAKQKWMDAFEDAKRRRQKELETVALKRSDTITYRERQRMMKRNPFLKGPSTESSRNPFDEEDELDEEDEEEDDVRKIKSGRMKGGKKDRASGKKKRRAPQAPKEQEKKQPDVEVEEEEEVDLQAELPEWLAEMSEDLEVFVAQREFESAADLLFRAKAYCAEHSEASALVREASKKVEGRTAQLITALKGELDVEGAGEGGGGVIGVGGSRGGPRAARRAVRLLVKLGRSALACRLFLQHRSAVLVAAVK